MADDILTNPRPDLLMDPNYIAARIRAAYWYTDDHEPTADDQAYWGGEVVANQGWNGFWWDKIVGTRTPVHLSPVPYPEPAGLLWPGSVTPPAPTPDPVPPAGDWTPRVAALEALEAELARQMGLVNVQAAALDARIAALEHVSYTAAGKVFGIAIGITITRHP